MKLVVASTALLNQLVLAGNTQQSAMFSGMSAAQNITDRNLVQMLDSANFQPYGCWCYPTSQYKKGKSMPQDEFDGHCKVLHDGYECAAIEIPGCKAYEIDYNPVFTDDVVADCEAANAGGDECAIAACKVEAHFVHNAINLLMSGFALDDALRHANGFDTSAECPKMGGNPNPSGNSGPNGGGTPRQCCGSFPEIEIYKPNKHDCCNNVSVFNPSMMTCCDDGRVVNIGSSC